MFVHIGNNIILEEKDIIGIYNIESMKDSEEYKNLIESLKRTDNLVSQANGDARIINNDKRKWKNSRIRNKCIYYVYSKKSRR